MITPAFNLTATERVLPKLALDFTTASLDSRITFTRALATATRINSSGYIEGVAADTPRFDFDPISKVCKGLLIEEARANRALQSNAFEDTTYWSRSNLASVDPDVSGVVSPEGIENADKIVENTAASVAHGIGQSFTASGGSVTFSFYTKFAGRNIQVYFRDLPFSGTLYGLANINLQLGTVTSSSDATVEIESLQDGWLRVSLTSTVTVPAGSRAVAIRLLSGTSTVTYTGNGTSGVYLYGAQIEAGAFATSYIPTEATAVTRNADVATMSDISWYNQPEGTIQVIGELQTARNTASAFVLRAASGTNLIRIGSSYDVFVAGAAQANFGGAVVSEFNSVGAYKENSFAFGKNGVLVGTDNSGTLPTATEANFSSGVSTYLNGWVRKLNYYPQRLTDNEVRAFSKL